MKYLPIALLAGFGLIAAPAISPALAQTTDPSTLHIGNGVTGTCPTGGCGIFNGNFTGGGTQEVNPFTTQLDLYQQSNGQAASLTSPMLMIFAVPNNAGAPSLSSPATLYSPITGGTTTSLPFAVGNHATPDTFQAGTSAFSLNGAFDEGSMTSGDVYQFLSTIASDPAQQFLLQHADNSASFVNMQTADAHLSAATGGAASNITATSFEIYVYAFEVPFDPNDAINVNLTQVPVGSFVFGFGEANNGTGTPNPFDTAMTEAGVETSNRVICTNCGNQGELPEPGSLAALGTALIALVGFTAVRRRRWI
jgi:hypothetical protein